ncbi:hypothetical protein CPB83DRAFT_211167 [Crepidotus variabilis]|uniref:Alpha/beta hydrolase fold-3 domain-containing protein n=1 Tax=Crepidotus variabilis TaxID=179855 RepID=A0A9P6JUV3_9AGAR|nr:hypothetical protein CPB83DRAFT_211167 [Crepidotus variabilis]
MTVSTFSAAVHITPVVIQTFFKHWKRKVKRLNDEEPQKEIPQDDLIFDQAFHIVKSFITLGTKNTIESLQAFTNTHVPAPPWAAVSPVLIPLRSCNEAADHLIEWFGPEELRKVVGGERWWQIRGLDGVDGEWIAEDEDLIPANEFKAPEGKKLSVAEANILRMETLESVMLYVHGGGYFWGSINTHRYQILHFAHKYRGRAFAVNYRKAPQYPWPCPIQDVLAAYLYLIRPPPEALHKAVDPSKIVFAGDSAGGGLCITTLTVLRDLGLPMPAGAVLISPWVDLTHSFPSVMANTATDIIPQHGFMARPSTLWPIPTVAEGGERVTQTVTNEPPKPGRPDTLKPSKSRVKNEVAGDVYGSGGRVKSQGAMLDSEDMVNSDEEIPNKEAKASSVSTPQASNSTLQRSKQLETPDDYDQWEPKPPKVLMQNENAVPLELRSQIQMYAPTEVLTHPLVSPVLQGSLGNLPPLYIIAGDSEVLRDEIVYLAHKAAHPEDFPTRPGVLRDCTRQKENAEKFTTPTKVHLQVFDGMCHVLTVFMFTKSAKYAYRSIGQFVKHITHYGQDHLARNPFPELHRPPDEVFNDDDHLTKGSKAGENGKKQKSRVDVWANRAHNKDDAREVSTPASDAEMYIKNEEIALQEVKSGTAESTSKAPSDTDKESKERDFSGTSFIRERVDIYGKVRPMEPQEEIPALHLQTSQIGIIKEAPTMRWLDGQKVWDKKYKSDTKKVLKQKSKNEAKVEKMMKNALDQGLIHDQTAVGTPIDEAQREMREETSSNHLKRSSSVGEIQVERRWGPLDLYDERPPATAIAGRRDTPDAVALWKKSIYHTAPVTHKTVPKLKAMEAVTAALDPKDDPNKAPRQSVSEQQVRGINPLHGLSMWDGLLRYFGRKTSKKAADGLNCAAEKVGLKDREDSSSDSQKIGEKARDAIRDAQQSSKGSLANGDLENHQVTTTKIEIDSAETPNGHTGEQVAS